LRIEVALVEARNSKIQTGVQTGKRTIDQRLDALAVELAAATDVAAVLALRTEIVETMRRLRLANRRGQRAMRRRLAAGRRARALRWQAEALAGALLLAMKARGVLRTSVGGNQKTEAGRARAGVTLRALGFRSWATAARWQRRAAGK
jgi:hypothetical protein